MVNKPKQPRPEPHLDELLDAALADTFPASDPVSGLTSSARRREEDPVSPPPRSRPD